MANDLDLPKCASEPPPTAPLGWKCPGLDCTESFFQLDAMQLGVDTVKRHQLLVGALFGHDTVFQ